MDKFPNELDGAKVLEVAIVDIHVVPTGNTPHRVDDIILDPAYVLAICQYENDDQVYYLFYCNEQWEVLTDGWHQSIESAKEQAEFEYEGISKKWKAVV